MQLLRVYGFCMTLPLKTSETIGWFQSNCTEGSRSPRKLHLFQFYEADSQEKGKSELWTIINLPRKLLFLFWDGAFREMGSNYVGKRREMHKHMQRLWSNFWKKTQNLSPNSHKVLGKQGGFSFHCISFFYQRKGKS